MRFVFAGLFLLAVLTAACGVQENNTRKNTSAPADTGAVSGNANRVMLTDALGRQVTFEQLPLRIVVAGKATSLLADALYMFPQAAERLVAISTAFQGVDFLPIVDPGFKEKTILAGQAGAEQIAAVNPDVVLMKSYLAGKLGKTIEEIGIPVVYLSLETPDEYLSETTSLGKLFGDEARAGEIKTFYRTRLDLVKQKVDSIPEKNIPSVLVLQHTIKGGQTAFRVPPADWMQTELVSLAGGKPVWKEDVNGSGWAVVTLEQIALWNPSQIYLIDYFDDPEKAMQDFIREPSMAMLDAVREHQVFAFPKDTTSWDQADTRWILGLLWLAKHIHPELFQTLDMDEAFRSFYQTLYRMDDDTIENQMIPRLSGIYP